MGREMLLFVGDPRLPTSQYLARPVTSMDPVLLRDMVRHRVASRAVLAETGPLPIFASSLAARGSQRFCRRECV